MGFTSNEGLGHLVKLPKDARFAISSALVPSFEGFIKVVDGLLRAESSQGSRAQHFLDASLPSGVPKEDRQVSTAIEGILFSCRAGLDHARSVAVMLSDDRSSFGAVTLTRGALEAFGKAWWLLGSDTADQLALRYNSSLLQELGALRGLDAEHEISEVLSGTPIGVTEMHSRVRATIAQLAPDGKPVAYSPASQAIELAGSMNDDGRSLYAQLSSIAHGEMIGLGSFLGVTTGTRTPQYTVGLPAWLAFSTVHTAFSAASTVMRDLLIFTQGDTEYAAEAGRLHDVALEVLKEERERAWRSIVRSRNSRLK